MSESHNRRTVPIGRQDETEKIVLTTLTKKVFPLRSRGIATPFRDDFSSGIPLPPAA
jgi:hypothetical protein